MERLTKEQAAVIGAYTGVACGPFVDIHEYAEKILRRPVWTHEFGVKEVWDKIKKASKDDFLAFCYDGDENG